MPEVLAQFTDTITGDDGRAYRAQVCGAAMNDGLWEGWIEFVPVDGGAPVRSPRETTQPNRVDAAYWATGLTAVYLEGALQRALRKPVVKRHPRRHGAPAFDRPAPVDGSVDARPRADPILDPFAVYERGDAALRQKLGALSAQHLVNIIVAYELSDEPVAAINRLPYDALIDLIADSVRAGTSRDRSA